MNLLFLISPLLIYFPLIIPNVETQPWLALSLSVLVLLGSMSKASVSLAILSAWFVFFVLVLAAIGTPLGSSLSAVQLLIGPLYLFAALRMKLIPPKRKHVDYLVIIFIIIGMVEIFAPGIYFLVADSILNRHAVASGYIGLSFLTPEPTYAVLSLVYVLFMALWSRQYWGAKSGLLEVALVILILTTLSTYALILLPLVLFFYWPKTSIISLVILLVAASLLATLPHLDAEESFRAAVAASRLLLVDKTDGLLSAISYADPSIGSRLITNVASYGSITKAPLGLGLGCDSTVKAVDLLKMFYAYDNPVIGDMLRFGCVKPQSYLAALFLAFGYGAIVIILITTHYIIKVRKFYLAETQKGIWWAALVVGLFVLVIQGQMSNPVPWLLLYFSLSKKILCGRELA
jgi:hypothetical protein